MCWQKSFSVGCKKVLIHVCHSFPDFLILGHAVSNSAQCISSKYCSVQLVAHILYRTVLQPVCLAYSILLNYSLDAVAKRLDVCGMSNEIQSLPLM